DEACTGTGSAKTAGTGRGIATGAERTSTGTASCESAGSDCQAYATTEVDSEADEQDAWIDRLTGTTVQPAALNGGDATAADPAGANVDCDEATCSGKASSATTEIGRAHV